LLHVAAAVLCCAHGYKPGLPRPQPWLCDGDNRQADVFVTALGEQAARVKVTGNGAVQPLRDLLQELRADAFHPAPPVLAFEAHRTAPLLPPFIVPAAKVSVVYVAL